MALDSWTNLKASVADWLHRPDLTTIIPDFITLAEERMSRDLADLPVMWGTATPSLAQGASTLSMEADSLGLVAARITAPVVDTIDPIGLQSLMAKTGGMDSARTGRPQMIAFRANGGSGGTPSAVVYPTADQNYTLEITYRKTVPALSGSLASNFILARAPSLYLYGSLLASSPYLKNDGRLKTWADLYGEALDRFKGQDWGGPVMADTSEVAAMAMGGGGGGYDITSG